METELKKVKEKCLENNTKENISADGTWPNGRRRHDSRNGTVTVIAQSTKKVIENEIFTKGVNFPQDSSSGSMEGRGLENTITRVSEKGLPVDKVILDGDSSGPSVFLVFFLSVVSI